MGGPGRERRAEGNPLLPGPSQSVALGLTLWGPLVETVTFRRVAKVSGVGTSQGGRCPGLRTHFLA